MATEVEWHGDKQILCLNTFIKNLVAQIWVQNVKVMTHNKQQPLSNVKLWYLPSCIMAREMPGRGSPETSLQRCAARATRFTSPVGAAADI
jgi:hypothetical protein